MSDNEVLVTRRKHLGAICLNRPKALNSLTLGMVRAFSAALDSFVEDPAIHAVLVTGAGERGFCAGGDIRALYGSRDGAGDYKRFWREEYQLNARIASFPKRYIVFMDGVVMGGGVGVSAHGNRRVVTERTRLAMPETGIGFIPDVGGSWLLTRDAGSGSYLALSGATIGAADAIHLGIADVAVESKDLAALESQLASIRQPGDVDAILSEFTQSMKGGVLRENKEVLDRVMRERSVEDIIGALRSSGSDFGRESADVISEKSPTSLKVTYALLKLAQQAQSLEICLINEFRAACRLLESHDLYEGIRAAIIDKDRRPQWSPATLDGVTESGVDAILRGSGDPEPVFVPWKTHSGHMAPRLAKWSGYGQS
jgi:enoyl-CoA hydratase